MTRDPQVRRVQLLAGIILGVIVGTAHALVTHIASRAVDPSVTAVEAPAWDAASDDGAAR
jgi:hypothetical protein